MSKQQTAVEWLQEQLNPDMKTMQGHIIQDLLDQAKAMEKEQLLDMGNQFAIMGEDSPEQYYTETFKSE
jgi:hypothetical protein